MCFFNHRYGKVESDGFQYCQKCGLGRMPKHKHEWEILEKASIVRRVDGTEIGTSLILKCKICGEISGKNHYIWG